MSDKYSEPFGAFLSHFWSLELVQAPLMTDLDVDILRRPLIAYPHVASLPRAGFSPPKIECARKSAFKRDMVRYVRSTAFLSSFRSKICRTYRLFIEWTSIWWKLNNKHGKWGWFRLMRQSLLGRGVHLPLFIGAPVSIGKDRINEQHGYHCVSPSRIFWGRRVQTTISCDSWVVHENLALFNTSVLCYYRWLHVAFPSYSRYFTQFTEDAREWPLICDFSTSVYHVRWYCIGKCAFYNTEGFPSVLIAVAYHCIECLPVNNIYYQ